MKHEKTERQDVLITGEAIAHARTYRSAARQLHTDGWIFENDFRLDSTISNAAHRLSPTSPDDIRNCFEHLGRSLKHGLPEDYDRRVKSLTACHGKLLTMYTRSPSPAGLGYMAIAQEESAILLSSIDRPRAQRDAQGVMKHAANLVDVSVLSQRHANWRGLASEIACLTGTNLRKTSNDLWRDHRIERDDPRMTLDMRALRAMPLYRAPANAFINESSRLITEITPSLKGVNHPIWGEDSIQKGIIALKSRAVTLHQRGKRLSISERALGQGRLMEALASLGERSALNLAHTGRREEAATLFAVSCTAAQRSYLYIQRSREAGPRQTDPAQLN